MSSVALRLRENLADRQLRSGIDLVTSSALNAIAGLAFWFVAARQFDEEVVGINAALLAIMTSVETFATLGLKNSLIRFLPSYGDQGASLVLRIYFATGAAALLLAPAAAIVLGRRIDGLSDLASPVGVAAFSLASFVWLVFVLQDSVLVAIGKTSLIPTSNLVYAVAKLGFLVVIGVGFSAPRWGIFGAWVLPLLLIVAWVNWVAFRSLARQPVDAVATPTRGLLRFAAGEYASAIVNMGLFGLLPVVVLAELGERSSAFYSLAFTIAYSLMLVNSNVSTALLAVASHRTDQLLPQTMKAARQMSMLVVPAAIFALLTAPYILRIFGRSYADNASNLLRLLVLTAIVNIPIALAFGVLRVRQNVGGLLKLHACRTIAILGLAVLLAPNFGLTGLGFAWLLGDSLLALGIIVAYRRTAIFVQKHPA